MKTKSLTTLEVFLIAVGLAFICVSIGGYFGLWVDLDPSLVVFTLLFAILGVMFAISAIYPLCGFLFNKLERPKFHWIFILAIPFLLFNLIGALSPVTDADGAGYHLAMIKIYQQAHHFVYHPNIVSNWPMSAEMVYGVMVHFGLPPKLLHYLFGILLAALVYAIAKREFNDEVAAWASVLTYTIPMVVLESGIAYVDLFFAFFIVAGLYLAYKYSEDNSNKTLFLSAIALGFGASIKWSGPAFVALATAFILLRELHKKGFLAALKRSWYPIPGVIFCSFWYIKNWILTGAPFVPFTQGLNWGYPNINAYLATINGPGLGIIPFIMTTWNLQFNGLGLGELTWLGPMFAAFLPLLLFKRDKPTFMRVALWFSAIFYGIWFITSPQSRLLLPIFVILTVFIAQAIQANKIFKAAAVIAILSALPFAVLYNGQSTYLCSGRPSCEYITEKIPAYPIYVDLNTNFPNASVLVYGDVHTYYLDTKYVWARPDMQGWITNYSDLRKYWITHVVINEDFNETPELKAEIHSNDLSFIEEVNDVSLWRVR